MGDNRAQNHFLPQLIQRLNQLYLKKTCTKTHSRKRRGVFAQLRDQLPPELQYFIARRVSDKLQDWVVNREYLGSLNWSETPAFVVPTGGEGLLRLNLGAREARGMLRDAEEREHYVAWLEERLAEVKV